MEEFTWRIQFIDKVRAAIYRTDDSDPFPLSLRAMLSRGLRQAYERGYRAGVLNTEPEREPDNV